jgi:peptidoglycan hydrolase CwlO-like protein
MPTIDDLQKKVDKLQTEFEKEIEKLNKEKAALNKRLKSAQRESAKHEGYAQQLTRAKTLLENLVNAVFSHDPTAEDQCAAAGKEFLDLTR